MDAAGDYELRMEVFEAAMQQLKVKPTIDLFVSSSNRKCQRFMALPGPGAQGSWGEDALLYSWAGEMPYAFPPIPLIPRVLQKLRQERLTAVVVLPEWYSKAWWNMAAPNITKSVVLGLATDVLKAGPAMPQDSKLPPGKLIMAIVSYS
jgi:hypothetical protein